MAQAIILPLLEKGDFLPEQIFGVVGDKNSISKLVDKLPRGLSVFSSSDRQYNDVWSAPVKLLAIKPQQFDEINQIFCKQPILNKQKRPLLISVVAGVPLKKLQKSFPDHACVRAVPNTPVLVKSGLTGLSWGDNVNPEQRKIVGEIFHPISEVLELPEKQLDAFLALTSSGPAYVALIIEALADGAVAAGLPRQLAHQLAHKTLSGSALLMKEKNLHPGELKDMVASPGGTTITALRHLEMAGVRSALIEAVVLAAERSRELA